jgi:hypothetical protein
MFPVILQVLEEDEQEIFLQFIFIVISCLTFEELFDQSGLDQICDKFYKNYDSLFGSQKCTYNVHIFCRHVTQLRSLGRLPNTSAACFEASFAPLRNSYAPGTQSVGKQLLEKEFLKKGQYFQHECIPTLLYFNSKSTAKSDDSIILQKSTKDWLRIKTVSQNAVTCTKIQSGPFEPMFGLDLTPTGVNQYVGESLDIVIVQNSDDIAGKGILVKNVLILVPTDVLLEEKH